jgi:hypothetical protein
MPVIYIAVHEGHLWVTNQETMKHNTQKGAKTLGRATLHLIYGTYGMRERIAKLGGFMDHSFVSHVVAGRKAPSLRFWIGLDKAIAELRADVSREIVRREHPEVDEATRGQQRV